MNETAMHNPSILNPHRMLRGASLLVSLVSLGALAAACGVSDPGSAKARKPVSDGVGERVGETKQALAGVDGNGTVAAPGTILNQYTTLAVNAAVNANTIQVGSVAALANGADVLSPGDLVLVMQMQGATLETASNTAAWGQINALNSAGLYEFVEVTGVNAATNTITLSCALRNTYAVAGNVQVIRVPQYDTLTVGAGGSVTAPAWNGTVGGVVAVHARSTVTLTGDINVAGLGFRGGAIDDDSGAAGTDFNLYSYAKSDGGARKGEGVGGLVAEFGRAPAGNGGGGGNAHNGGGGGGSNARSGGAWTGQGVFDLGITGGKAAWLLDPGFNALSSSEGGGRGGYTFSSTDQNALLIGPDKALWGGNSRRERGGLGGHPVDNDPATRIFLGGGGGAGDGNNAHSGRGGNGGGAVFLIAGAVSGAGRILANGEAGVTANSKAGGAANGDSPGGGGAGGSVIVRAATVQTISVQASGGTGGSQIVSNGDEAEGPGGGGGGGFVSITAIVPTLVAGGASGTTNSPAVSEFPANGATAGNSGQTQFGTGVPAVPFCIDSSIPDTSIAPPLPANPTSKTTGSFMFKSTDAAATFECRLGTAVFATCPAAYTTPVLADGTYTIEVRARDVVGNLDATPAAYTWRVDTAPPDTTIATTPTNPTSNPEGAFTFTATETGTFECRIDAGAYAPCTASYTTAALTPGSHTIDVRAVDAAGNVDLTPATYTWLVDTAPPETTIATRPPNPSLTPAGAFTFTANEPGTFQCRIDADAFALCTASYTTPALATGSHTIEVRAIDTAGNVDATPATYTWVVNADTDGDGLGDDEERTIRTDPTDADTDDDGIPDGAEPTPGVDSDGDGLVNARDPDSDNDGILDGTETGVTVPPAATDPTRGNFRADADPTTTTDPLDRDTDAGGVGDGIEDTDRDGAIDVGERNPNDPLDDGVARDSDYDDLTDSEEVSLGTNPLDADSDDDGLLDGAEPNPSNDSDGDGLINPLDPDSDDDGLFDGTEVGKLCDHVATDVRRGLCIADSDITTMTSPLDPDTDGGGVRDGSEDSNLNGRFDTDELDPILGRASDDTYLVDTDGDGLSDGLEDTIRSNPNDADTDDDGLLDGDEPNPTADGDADGLVDVLDVDSDNDGLFDGTESSQDCSHPSTAAASGHCRADLDMTTFTSAVNHDSDAGGVRDGSEDTNLNGRVDGIELDPVSGHGTDDATSLDSDADGISDPAEEILGSDPDDADSDDDGLLDGDEPNPSDDHDGDGNDNILDPDSDGDGLFDGTEAGKACVNPPTALAAARCIADADSGATTTRVLIPDTDHGGVTDGDEDTNRDGATSSDERDPLDPTDDGEPPGGGGAGGMGGGIGDGGVGGVGLGGAAGAGGSSEAGAGGEGEAGAPATGGTGVGGATTTGGRAGNGGSISSGGRAANGGTSTGTGGAQAPTDDKSVILGGGLCAFRPLPSNGMAATFIGLVAAAALARRRRRAGDR